MTPAEARSVATMFALGVYYLDSVEADDSDPAIAARRVFSSVYNATGLSALTEAGFQALPGRLDVYAPGWNSDFRLALFAVLSFVTQTPVQVPRYFNQIAAWWHSAKATVDAKTPLGALELVMPLEWAAPQTEEQVRQSLQEAYNQIDADAAAARVEDDAWAEEGTPDVTVAATVASEAAVDTAAAEAGEAMEVVAEDTGVTTLAGSTILASPFRLPSWAWVVGGVVLGGGLLYGGSLLWRDRRGRRAA